MPAIHVIEHHGRAAALVVGDEAIIAQDLHGDALRIVQAKCLYALQIDAGAAAGPYDEATADRFARFVMEAPDDHVG